MAKYGLQKPTKKPLPNFKYVIWFNPKTGEPTVSPIDSKRYRMYFGVSKSMQKGWFSTERGKGKLKEQKARKWLNRVLGIADEDVFITNSVLRAHSDKKAYGVMRVMWDVFRQEFNPQIVLSKHSGKGVEYHEAWHYISQLILTDAQRSQLY
mgnify:FL=1